ncbi:MAG: TIGR04282 family arsenosugar biosynthesis glycosyltransferase [Mariprofundaceae bacterium]|nr:TIGR04282 family arsenosugar biosynthesis glycosyltransferase [Mariprofundaceae bacterium]
MMDMMIVVMCKAPMQGKVKTRLMTKYSALEAMQWHEAMAYTVIERAKRMFTDVVIATDDVKHPFFKLFELPLLAQGVGDLGARMGRMMQQVCPNDEAVLFLGTDSPHMQDIRLLQAVDALQTHDVVLGAVEDGGYDLIAMRKPSAAMLQGVDWGTEKVLQQSVNKADALGLSYHILSVSFDVDTPEMLERAIQMGWVKEIEYESRSSSSHTTPSSPSRACVEGLSSDSQ